MCPRNLVRFSELWGLPWNSGGVTQVVGSQGKISNENQADHSTDVFVGESEIRREAPGMRQRYRILGKWMRAAGSGWGTLRSTLNSRK